MKTHSHSGSFDRILFSSLLGMLLAAASLPAQQQEDTKKREERVRLEREANERTRQTQRILEVDRNNPRASRALEAQLGEASRGGERAVERAERPAGPRAANSSGGGNEKKGAIDLSRHTLPQDSRREYFDRIAEERRAELQRSRVERAESERRASEKRESERRAPGRK